MDVYSLVSIFGVHDGVPVRLDRYASAYSFTTHAFLEEPLPFDFLISPEGLGDSIAHFLGFHHEIETGDVAFDKKLKISTTDPDRLRRLLNPELKEALYALHAFVGTFGLRGFHVSQGAVSITRAYATNWITPQNIVNDIPIAVATAQKLKLAAAGAYR